MAQEWMNGMPPELQAHVTAKGWDKHADPIAAMTEAAKAHHAAEGLIGADPAMVLKLPKDANDPSFQTIYDRVTGMRGVPAATDYKFDGIAFKDGTPLDEGDLAFVRDFATKHKMPVAVARELVATMAARAEEMEAGGVNMVAQQRGANEVALRGVWGVSYEQRAFTAAKAMEALGLPAAVRAAVDQLPQEDYRKAMDAFVQLGAQMTEAAMLRGGTPPQDPLAALSPQQAEQRLGQLKQDTEWVKRFLAGDDRATQEFQKLTRIMVGAPAA